MLTIAIDFDDTLTADAEMWEIIIPIMRQKHRVVCVTQRNATEENEDMINDWMDENRIMLPIYFTNGMPKDHYMLSIGQKVDIFVDDNIRRAAYGC